MAEARNAFEDGDSTKGIDFLRKVIALNGKEPAGILQLADALQAENDLKGAEENYRRVLDADKTNIRALDGVIVDWVLRFDVPAGTPLNVAQLAKQFSVPPHSLQEFLSGLSHFGLVERRPRGGWRLLGFTPDYAVELTEFRMVLEMNAVRALATLPQSHPVWAQLTALRADHVALLQRIETDFHDFSKLDEQFHGTINSVVRNRFVEEFQKVISLIFHYHYQWDKKRERQRNETAIREHLTILDALQRHDGAAAEAAARAHLLTSKETLLASLRVNMLA